MQLLVQAGVIDLIGAKASSSLPTIIIAFSVEKSK